MHLLNVQLVFVKVIFHLHLNFGSSFLYLRKTPKYSKCADIISYNIAKTLDGTKQICVVLID